MSDKSWEPGMFLKTWKTHTLSLSLLSLLSLLLLLSLSHSLTLNMLNNFCFHVYAQKSMFKVENVNAFFWHQCFFLTKLLDSTTLSCEFGVHRAGSQLKIIRFNLPFKFSRPPTKTNPVSEQMTNYSGNIFIFATMGPSQEEYLKDLKSSDKAFHKTSSHFVPPFVYITTALLLIFQT